MKHWRLLEQIFTAETIMTARESLLLWDEIEPVLSVWQKADEYQIDTIPVIKAGEIRAIIQRGSDMQLPITYDWIVTTNAPLPLIIRIFSESSKQCLLVFSGQTVVGLVTPADLNKLPARTYFYNLMAELELVLAEHIIWRGFSEEAIYRMIGKDEQRQREIHNKLNVSDLDVNIVHTLYLSEMVNIIKEDEKLRNKLGIASKSQVEKQLNGLVHFRNDIMHPNNLLLNDKVGVTELHKRIQKIKGFLE